MKKKILLPAAALVLLAILSGCAPKKNTVTILYTNDIHTYVNNMVTEEDGSEHPGMNYGKIAAMKKDLQAAGETVLLVDAGDHLQGTAYGAMDEGRAITDLMNAAGYDLATPGNHEFDYGLFRFFSSMAKAKFPYISCNFYEVSTESPLLQPSYVVQCGDKKVAFVGISSPETMYSTTPRYFQDADGNFLYWFLGSEEPKDLYGRVQEVIDSLRRDGADYVIALGHVGVEPTAFPKSTDVIANTRGLDAFIDGHSHTTMEKQMVKDADGKEVLLTQTGCFFDAVGKMTIAADGTIDTKLVTEYENTDELTAAEEQKLIDGVKEVLGKKLAESTVTFRLNDPEAPEKRIIRFRETNLGDLCADACYWYFNEDRKLACDIALYNSGSIRAEIPAGDITLETAKSVHPYGNMICLVEAKGKDILDALEWTARDIGRTENGEPVENGNFLHVAGMKYTIDAAVSSTVAGDSNGSFQHGPTGEYKVRDVQVYDRKTGQYVLLDPEKTYAVSGTNFMLRDGGCGLVMFQGTNAIMDYAAEDYMVLADYLTGFAENAAGMPTVSTEGCPLAAYENYLLNYEDAFGSGRITVK